MTSYTPPLSHSRYAFTMMLGNKVMMVLDNQMKYKWKLFKKVEEVLIEGDAQIFGGYVRDSIIHDTYAKKFYETTADASKYAVADFEPETALRNTLPTDIDCLLPEGKVQDLLKALKKVCHLKFTFMHDCHTYFQNLYYRGMSHNRYTVTYKIPKELDINPLLYGTFHLDIMTYPDSMQVSLPLSPIDFACNSLMQTKDGYSLMKYRAYRALDKLRELGEVIEDIINKRAVTGPSIVTKARVDKMVEKGWTVTSGHVTIIPQVAYAGHCLICHEGFTAEGYKMACCDGHYHRKCLYMAMKTGPAAMEASGKCLMCRAAVHVNAVDVSLVAE